MFKDRMTLSLTVGDAHVLLDALISYIELSNRMMSGEVDHPLAAPNVPMATLANVAEIYQRVAGQIGDDRRQVMYPAHINL